MGPKYLLIYEPNKYNWNFAIYEQANINGTVAQRIINRYPTIDGALQELSTLNDGQPVLLAYTTKPIDNSFSV